MLTSNGSRTPLVLPGEESGLQIGTHHIPNRKSQLLLKLAKKPKTSSTIKIQLILPQNPSHHTPHLSYIQDPTAELSTKTYQSSTKFVIPQYPIKLAPSPRIRNNLRLIERTFSLYHISQTLSTPIPPSNTHTNPPAISNNLKSLV